MKYPRSKGWMIENPMARAIEMWFDKPLVLIIIFDSIDPIINREVFMGGGDL